MEWLARLARWWVGFLICFVAGIGVIGLVIDMGFPPLAALVFGSLTAAAIGIFLYTEGG